MDNVEELHDGSAVVGNGDGSLIVVDELVHPSRTERGSNHVANRRDGVDVAEKLSFPLRSVCAFFQQYDLRLLLAKSSEGRFASVSIQTYICVWREYVDATYHHRRHCRCVEELRRNGREGERERERFRVYFYVVVFIHIRVILDLDRPVEPINLELCGYHYTRIHFIFFY